MVGGENKKCAWWKGRAQVKKWKEKEKERDTFWRGFGKRLQRDQGQIFVDRKQRLERQQSKKKQK